jgi:hypothetical protein
MSTILRCSLLTLIGLFALSAIGLFVITRDEAAPEVGDLTPRPLTLPAEENGYFILQKLATEFAALPKDEDYDAALSRLRGENGWSISDAAVVVSHANSIWPQFDAATGQAQSNASLPSEQGKSRSYVSALNKLWEIAQIRIKLAAHTSGPDEALALALLAHRRALHIADAGGDYIDMVVGIGLHTSAHEELVKLLTNDTPSSQAMRHCIDVLEETRMSAASCADSLKTGYAHMPAEIEAMRQAHGTDADFFGEDLPWGAQWLYKPNQTKRMAADLTRRLIAAIDQPYWVIKQASAPMVSPVLFAKVPTPDNAYGKYFMETIPGTLGSLLRIRLKAQTRVSVTQAWIAAILFERVHGNLPESLDQLVPEYFPTVPRDYFTGESIRYSPVVRAVWSAGENDLVLTSSDQEIPSRAIAMKLKPRG